MANGKVLGYVLKKNKAGGSFRTGSIDITVDPKKVLHRFYFERSGREFRHRVASHIQETVLKPRVKVAYRELIMVGLPAVIQFNMPGNVAFTSNIKIPSPLGGVVVKTQTWMKHSKAYRKRYNPSHNGYMRNRTGTHQKAIISKLLNQSGLKGKYVVNNPIKRDFKTVGGKLKIQASVRITHKLSRPDYDNLIKLAFFDGVVHSPELIKSYGTDRDIGILNAFETGFGGRGRRYSRRRHRPIIGETAKAYGEVMRRSFNSRISGLL